MEPEKDKNPENDENNRIQPLEPENQQNGGDQEYTDKTAFKKNYLRGHITLDLVQILKKWEVNNICS